MSSDLVLAIIGSVGIAALAMSMNDDAKKKKEVREDFNGFALRNSKLDKVVQDKNGLHTFPVDQYPNIKCNNKNGNVNNMKSVENYSQNNRKPLGSGLGANQNTNMPFVTPTPHYNQTVNKPSPSLNLPALIRYNPPSISNMGITEDYQCKKTPIRENFVDNATCTRAQTPYMSPVADYVGQNYTAGSMPTATMNPYVNSPLDGISAAGDLSDPFNGKEVMVFDRPMTTTLKVGRFAARGCRDLIRGDLPCAPNTHQGWFSTPADPTALSKGALQAIAGVNENSTVLNKFMEIYGDASGVGAGVNLADNVDYQYTAYEMTNQNQGVCNNTVSVSSF